MEGRHHAGVGAAVGALVVSLDHGPPLFTRALESVHPLAVPHAPAAVAAQSIPHALAEPIGSVLAYLVGGAIAAVFALVPDLDSPESTLGKLLPRWWHALTPGHRGPTHWIASGLLVGGVAWLCGAVSAGGTPASNLFPHLVLAGYLIGHLACDLPTRDGVPLFGPFLRANIRLPWRLGFRTGGVAEPVVAWAMSAVLLAWACGLGPLVALLRGGLA
jgi:membrane-bound metal-dependent hydrolase YbcI (DUF457 family)